MSEVNNETQLKTISGANYKHLFVAFLQETAFSLYVKLEDSTPEFRISSFAMAANEGVVIDASFDAVILHFGEKYIGYHLACEIQETDDKVFVFIPEKEMNECIYISIRYMVILPFKRKTKEELWGKKLCLIIKKNYQKFINDHRPQDKIKCLTY